MLWQVPCAPVRQCPLYNCVLRVGDGELTNERKFFLNLKNELSQQSTVIEDLATLLPVRSHSQQAHIPLVPTPSDVPPCCSSVSSAARDEVFRLRRLRTPKSGIRNKKVVNHALRQDRSLRWIAKYLDSIARAGGCPQSAGTKRRKTTSSAISPVVDEVNARSGGFAALQPTEHQYHRN